MDPISAIFVMTVLGGLFVKGVDVATDGLLSTEVGAGIRGAGSYTARDVRARWQRASEKAREVRMQTRPGRAVQGILDDAAAVGRTGWTIGRLLFGEARQFGSGIRSEWQTAREQARSVRTERRGDAPWPVTQWLRDGLVRLQETRTKAPNGEPNEAGEAPNGDPDPSPFVAAEDPEQESDGLGPLPPKCPDCGMPIVLPNGLNDHRMGRDRCHYADMDDDPDDPNGDPNVPLESTVPNENGDVRCGCCAQLHKPLAPGEHCPDCHIHDHPNGTTPNAPTTKGPSMDINSAPAAIAAAETLRGRFEEPESLLASLHQDAVSTLEGMGDFGTGDETDTVGRFQPVIDALGSAREAWDVYVAALHEEWDEHIAAAEGRTAGAHGPFQEV